MYFRTSPLIDASHYTYAILSKLKDKLLARQCLSKIESSLLNSTVKNCEAAVEQLRTWWVSMSQTHEDAGWYVSLSVAQSAALSMRVNESP